MNKNNGKRTTVALYILLALIIVSVAALTVISISSNRRESKSPVSTSKETAKETELTKPDKGRDETLPFDIDPVPETDEETEAEKTSDDKGFICVAPVAGYLLKGYSVDMPIFSVTMNDYRVHTGIDVRADAGAPVMAFSEGTVSGVYNDPMMGNCVSIEHSNGIVSYCMGLSDEVPDGIYEGAPVYCGQVIGSVGDSTLIELSDDTHLHFALKQNGEYIDPLAYVFYESVSSEQAVADSYEG